MPGTQAKSGPWASIWLQPTITFDRLVSKSPGYRVKTLAIVYGILVNLPGLFATSSEFHISLLANVLLIIVFGGALGLAAIYVRGWLLLLLSRLFKLRADATKLRTVLAWATLPFSAAYLLAFLLVSLKQMSVPTSPAPLSITLSLLSLILGLAAWIWMLFILVSGLAVIFRVERNRVIPFLVTYVLLVELPLELGRRLLA